VQDHAKEFAAALSMQEKSSDHIHGMIGADIAAGKAAGLAAGDVPGATPQSIVEATLAPLVTGHAAWKMQAAKLKAALA
jgi:hypothetical protein